MSILNLSCSVFFLRPNKAGSQRHHLHQKNTPLGNNKSGKMMKAISVGTKLSQIYTNHSVWASALTLLSDVNVPDCHNMFVSGHGSKHSIAHYSSSQTPSQMHLRITKHRAHKFSLVTNAPLTQSSNQMAFNESMSNATTSFLSGFSNSCNEGNIQVFFHLQRNFDDKN